MGICSSVHREAAGELLPYNDAVDYDVNGASCWLVSSWFFNVLAAYMFPGFVLMHPTLSVRYTGHAVGLGYPRFACSHRFAHVSEMLREKVDRQRRHCILDPWGLVPAMPWGMSPF